LINLHGGIATPLGDFKVAARLGFMGGVGFDYMATEALAVGGDGSFHWTNIDVSSTQFIGIQSGVTIGMGTPSQ
jgi:hypothetical protein